MTAPELVAKLEALLPGFGSLPLSEEWMYTAIRHCQRNEDFDFDDEGFEPDRYAGTAIAQLVNLVPEILAALRSAGAA